MNKGEGRSVTGFLFRHVILALAIFWLPQAALAAQGSVEALIDKTQGSLDDQFVVTLTIQGQSKGEVEAPVIDGCEVVKSGVSQNMQWINGEFSAEVQHTFVIIPQRVGTFTVPSWKIMVGGEEVTTLPLKFTVQGGGGGRGGRGVQPSAPGGQQSPPPGQPAPRGVDGDDIYIERELPERAPYVGEAFASTIRVFHKVQITAATPKRDSSPEFRMLSVPGDKTYQRVINGVRYQIIEFKEVLIPLKPGTHSIPPYRLQANIIRPGATPRGGSVFDFFNNRFFGGNMGSLQNFFGREESVEVKGKPASVQVKSMPDGAPAGFEGLVGDFSLNAAPQQREVSAGDSVTVGVTVEGTGSLDTLTLEKLQDDLRRAGKVYPDKPVLKEEFKTDGDGNTQLRSRKEFKLALVPESPAGEVDLGAVSLVFFNPVTGTYATAGATLGAIRIQPAAAGEPAAKPAAEARQKQPAADQRRLPVALLTLLLAVTGVLVAATLWSRGRRQPVNGAPPSAAAVPSDFPEADEGLVETLEPGDAATGTPALTGDSVRVSEQHFESALREAGAGMTGQALVSVGHGLREILSAEAGRRVDAMTPREIAAMKLGSEHATQTLALLEQVEAAIFADHAVTLDYIHNLVGHARVRKP